MYTALLRGVYRPRVFVVTGSRFPFYLRVVHRCHSSEAEIAKQENEMDKPDSSTDNASLLAADKLRSVRGLRNERAANPASSRLPWASLDTVPPKPWVSSRSDRPSPPAAIPLRSGPNDASRAVSARLPWDVPVGMQRSSESKMNGDTTPVPVEGAAEKVGVTGAKPVRARIQPLPSASQDMEQSDVSRHQSNTQIAGGQATARLPWERMIDGLVSGDGERGDSVAEKDDGDGIPAGRTQSKLEQLTDEWARSGPPGQAGLSGAAKAQQKSRGWDLIPSQDARNERARSPAQPMREQRPMPAPRATSLPWESLPGKGKSNRFSRDSGGEEQRKMMDKMMGSGRYGGSPAAHRGGQGASRKRREVKAVVAKQVQIAAGPVSVRDLAVAMSKKAREVTKMLRQMGETNVSPEFMVDPDTAELVALEFGLRTKRLKLRNGDLGRTVVTKESFDSLAPRPAVVSVMGHVDHGKTTLLDALRTSKVAGTESAGITQKIGAFSVDVNDSSVTFFDTPGHAAFKSMRHSTSRLTDIVLIVIAADDGVKSQTVEVLQLLNEFPNLAPVVAVTKIDRYGIDAEKAVDTISRQLLEHNVITEGYGGQVPIVPVSAVTREGFDNLLDTLMLQAEILELRADDKAPAEGVVVDSSMVKGKGGVADVLISWGKLKLGDVVVAGLEYGKVRSLSDSQGARLKEAGAAEPVRVVGMKGLPRMGDEVLVVESEARAKAIVGQRRKQEELKQLEKQEETLGLKRVSEEAIKRLKAEAQQAIRRREAALFHAREAVRTMKSRRDESSAAAAAAAEAIAAKAMEKAEEAVRKAKMQEEEEDVGPTKFYAIFKAEGFGQLEAMSQVMNEVPQEEVELSLVRTGLGSVTQSDVEAAALAGAPIFAFNAGPVPSDVKAIAQREGVQIHNHDVIYRFLDGVKAVMSELLPPEKKETVIGEGKTLEVFEASGRNKESVKVAGLTVSSGKLSREHLFRVVRDEEILADGLRASSMRRFKDKVSEVTKDKECGVALEGFNDFEEGDIVQCYILDEMKRSL